ncbi:MAG: YigZ family protein [Mongoliibacter sp.]|uniref:IMPACT family protein n=1 Tax=Mongoliibacter sp. TaxID=2022438 RepID=UPI0012F00C08|nr:YigZ family protein [Mongoliibacter sp.]TVP53008.1 MAG: YigZ family protein [Mongoliibacter sp.]
MKDTYLTIEKPSEGFYKEKGSKFLAYSYPVQDEDEVKTRLEELRKKYYDARHYCYAYMLGREMEVFRANDDGEPNHSAGDPILGQIRSANLTDILIVVVRYFGGTKLGVSGLINAYKSAAAEAIQHSEIIEKIVRKQISLEFEYPEMNEIMRIIKEHDLEIKNQELALKCSMEIEIRESDFKRILEKFELLSALGHVKIFD